MKNIIKTSGVAILMGLSMVACKKLDRPALGNYAEDSNPPGGPLKFYAAFDGTSKDPLINAVDSIKANFPSMNDFGSVDGISGKALSGVNKKFVKYPKPNDWAVTSKSFTISIWEKHNGQTKNNAGGNGPEYPYSFKSSNGHWSGASMFLILEGDNAGCAVKFMTVDAANADNWFTWENANVIPGMLDNNWHHVVLVYDAATSITTLYLDGVANSILPKWGTHGNINFDESKISEFRVGAGPGTNYDSDDWLSSSWKGALDQLRMYNVALSAAEVKALYATKL